MQKPFSVKNLCLVLAAASVPVPASVLSPFVISNPSLQLLKFLGSEEALTSVQVSLLRSYMLIMAMVPLVSNRFLGESEIRSSFI